jgi:hypothetical protein
MQKKNVTEIALTTSSNEETKIAKKDNCIDRVSG